MHFISKNFFPISIDNFSYFGKPMYNSYSIGYPYMNNFGYSMGSGYGTGFPPINFGFGHPGLSYGPGYGMNYGPSIGGYNWFNKKDFHDYHFHGIGNGIHIGGGSFDDYHRSKRYGHEAADISPAASITAPTSMFMNKQKSLSSKQQLPLHSQYLINENN